MSKVRCMVVKVGTAVLTGDDGRLDTRRSSPTSPASWPPCANAASGHAGHQRCRRGGHRPDRSARPAPSPCPLLQATAAIGQPSLMALYAKALARHGLHAGPGPGQPPRLRGAHPLRQHPQHAGRPAPPQGHPHHQRERHHRRRGTRPLRRQRHHRRPDDQPAAGRPAGDADAWWTACSTAPASGSISSPRSTIVPGPRPDREVDPRQRRHGHQAGPRGWSPMPASRWSSPTAGCRTCCSACWTATESAPSSPPPQAHVRPPAMADRRRPAGRHARHRCRRRPGRPPATARACWPRASRTWTGEFDRGDDRPRRRPRRPGHRPRHLQLLQRGTGADQGPEIHRRSPPSSARSRTTRPSTGTTWCSPSRQRTEPERYHNPV